MTIVPVKKAIESGQIHISMPTAYKWHSLGRNPNLVFKFAGKLCVDMDAWKKEAERARDAHVLKSRKVRQTA